MSQQLPQSIYPLAVLAAREAGADGFAIYRIAGGGWRELKLSWGALAPETAEFPLRVAEDVAGLLTFIFCGGVISPGARSLLEQIAEVIEDIWRLAALPASHAREAARIAQMEAALTDSKIADRARAAGFRRVTARCNRHHPPAREKRAAPECLTNRAE